MDYKLPAQIQEYAVMLEKSENVIMIFLLENSSSMVCYKLMTRKIERELEKGREICKACESYIHSVKILHICSRLQKRA